MILQQFLLLKKSFLQAKLNLQRSSFRFAEVNYHVCVRKGALSVLHSHLYIFQSALESYVAIWRVARSFWLFAKRLRKRAEINSRAFAVRFDLAFALTAAASRSSNINSAHVYWPQPKEAKNTHRV